jgi:arsenate reductase-like glutaredoxin family protein
MNRDMKNINSPKIISIFDRKNSSPKKISSNKLKTLLSDFDTPVSDKKETTKIISRQRNTPKKVSAIQQIPQKKVKCDTPSDDKKLLNRLINFITPHKELIKTPVLIRPDLVNQSFNRRTAHKVIDGVKYRSLKDLKQNKIKCMFETCEISWENAKWINR